MLARGRFSAHGGAGTRAFPIVESEPQSVPARALVGAAERAAAQISIASYQQKRSIPLTPVR